MKGWGKVGIAFLTLGMGWGQPITLPASPDEFGSAFKAALERIKRPDIQQRAQAFFQAWTTGDLTPQEKEALAQRASRWHAKGMRPFPELLQFLEVAIRLKSPETRLRIPIAHFLKVSDTLWNRQPAQLTRFWEILGKIVPEGIINQTTIFAWKIDKSEARLDFHTYTDSSTLEQKEIPVLFFKNCNLICSVDNKDIVIREVDGILNLTNRHFLGTKGKADWSRLGPSPSELYVQMERFEVDMNIRKLECFEATLHYPGFLPYPVRGKFYDDFTIASDPVRAKSPTFEMTEGRVEIKEFIPNTTYRGGFGLQGLTKYGSAVGDTLGELSVYVKNKQVMSVFLNRLDFNPKMLTAQEVAVELYLPFGDTIFYPVTDLLYDVNTQEILLNRNRRNPRTRQGFYSTYHKVEMLFDAIRWNPARDTVMHFTAIVDPKGKVGIVQSIDYFNQQEYESYKDILPIHPLGAIYKLIKDRQQKPSRRVRNVILDADVLKSQKLNTQTYLKPFSDRLKDVETYGFLRYEPEVGIIEPLPKLFRWTQAAFGEKDYDALRILSQTEHGDNALLDLRNKEITLRGVEYIVFADSHIVEIAPYKGTVYLGENRSIRMAGRLAAGKVDLYVRPEPRMIFDYENFKILFFNVDSLKFRPERDPLMRAGRYPRVAKSLASLRIENVSGCVYIDLPSNKNGRKSIPHYSILDCYGESYKYWESSTIQNNQYKRDRLFFELDPFMLDSLEIFSLLGLEFHGVFSSDSILPPFRDTLKVMPDGSYGIQEVFAEGIPVYKAKGKFYGRIAMDNFGLHGSGEISYLTNRVMADTFVFHFDSCMAEKARMNLPASTYAMTRYPAAEGEGLRFIWYPYEGKVVVESGKKPLQLYGGQAKLQGRLIYTPEGLRGAGALEIADLRIQSQSFSIGAETFKAVDCQFAIIDSVKKDTLLLARNMELDYALKTQQTIFNSMTVGETNIELPRQHIATSLGKGVYNREKASLSLTANVPDESKNFVVQRVPGKKEVSFNTQTLAYNMKTGVVEADRVDSIIVADATIFPKDKHVQFLSDGKVAPLENATIKAPTGLNHHVLTDAHVEIFSGSDYKAHARYKYTDIEGKPQYIRMDSIFVKDGITIAYARIKAEDEFLLTDRILFRDEVELRADRRFLFFKGEVRIQSDNEFFRESWFAFEGVVNPDTVFIPIKDPKNRKGQELTVGLHFVPLYRTFYTNFLQPRRNKDDIDVLIAEGGLSVDRATKSFRIGPMSKISGQTYRGNWIEYNDATRITTAYGRLNFPAAIPPGGAQVVASGSWREEQKQQKLSTDLVLGLSWANLPASLTEALGNKVSAWTMTGQDMEYTEPRFIEALAELLDPDPTKPEVNTQEILQAAQRTSVARGVPLAKKLPYTLLLAKVPFKRSDSTGALYASGPVAVAGIGGISVAKYCPARIEYSFGAYNPVERTRNPDVITLYIEPTEESWIFITYSGYFIRMITSDDNLNKQIRQVADKQKDYNKDPNKPKLQLIAADPTEKDEFLQRFAAYLLN
ncbi:MAG: hypothetical protein RMK98_05880 [Bacteroidia bacterium]|nr:hypothetical protein [Bacteroidia bacterium]